jgi:CheY-like chemotaxis protein
VVRSSLRRLFERAGWTVCGEAANGQEAVAKAQQFKPDIAVLDLSMPVMNGLTAARLLKDIVPRMKLILFTSFGSVLANRDLRGAGFSALVAKDDARQLLTTAQVLLEAASPDNP